MKKLLFLLPLLFLSACEVPQNTPTPTATPVVNIGPSPTVSSSVSTQNNVFFIKEGMDRMASSYRDPNEVSLEWYSIAKERKDLHFLKVCDWDEPSSPSTEYWEIATVQGEDGHVIMGIANQCDRSNYENDKYILVYGIEKYGKITLLEKNLLSSITKEDVKKRLSSDIQWDSASFVFELNVPTMLNIMQVTDDVPKEIAVLSQVLWTKWITSSPRDFPFHPSVLPPKESLQKISEDLVYGTLYMDVPRIEIEYPHKGNGGKYENVGSVKHSENIFYLQRKDGFFYTFFLLDPISGNDVKNPRFFPTNIPDITWEGGVKNTFEYSDREYGWDCPQTTAVVAGKIGSAPPNTPFEDISEKNLISVEKNDVEEIGKITATGESVYGLKDSKNVILQNIYQNALQKGLIEDISYDQFLQEHPLFFWYDPFGRLIKFENTRFIVEGSCGQ